MKAQRAGTLPLILFFLAACGGEGPRGALVESRDSARVLIVENRHTLDDLPLFVILDPEPLLKLGVADGDPQRRFGEVHFAARLG